MSSMECSGRLKCARTGFSTWLCRGCVGCQTDGRVCVGGGGGGGGGGWPEDEATVGTAPDGFLHGSKW